MPNWSYGAGYSVLEERDLPVDLVVAGAPYLGPPLVTKNDPCLRFTRLE